MAVFSFIPTPPLDQAVAAIWYVDDAQATQGKERVVPTGALQVLVNLDRDVLHWWDGPRLSRAHHLPGAVLAGAFASPFGIDTAEQRAITGVAFHPGGAAAFLGRGLSDYAGTHVPLADVGGFSSLREALLEAHVRGGDAVRQTWDAFLRARFEPTEARALRAMCDALESGRSVQAVADSMSVSVRKLRNDCRSLLGLSPKAFSRVRRLRRLARSIARVPAEPHWAALAAEHGYFDQAHMIREFRTLAGVTPSAYRPRSPEAWNHLSIRECRDQRG